MDKSAIIAWSKPTSARVNKLWKALRRLGVLQTWLSGRRGGCFQGTCLLEAVFGGDAATPSPSHSSESSAGSLAFLVAIKSKHGCLFIAAASCSWKVCLGVWGVHACALCPAHTAATTAPWGSVCAVGFSFPDLREARTAVGARGEQCRQAVVSVWVCVCSSAGHEKVSWSVENEGSFYSWGCFLTAFPRCFSTPSLLPSCRLVLLTLGKKKIKCG